MAKVGLVDDDLFQEHQPRDWHPETPDRLPAIRAELERRGLDAHLTRLAPRDATREEIERIHHPDHYAAVERSQGSYGNFDPDTYHGPRSFAAARRAAGGLIAATEQAVRGEIAGAVCAVRPPGHHAMHNRLMGFCLFNNVAIAAAHARATLGCERVLIVDWDVHHGNGTQHSFDDDPSVLYLSMHQYPFYPGTGHFTEIGAGAGEGYSVNVPLPVGFGDGDYLAIYDELFLPLARAFDPDLVLVSAGFDNHVEDLIGSMRVSEDGFAAMADRLLALRHDGQPIPTVLTLEGGYNVQAQARSLATVTERLLSWAGDREAPEPAPETGAHPMREKLLGVVKDTLRPHWPDVL